MRATIWLREMDSRASDDMGKDVVENMTHRRSRGNLWKVYAHNEGCIRKSCRSLVWYRCGRSVLTSTYQQSVMIVSKIPFAYSYHTSDRRVSPICAEMEPQLSVITLLVELNTWMATSTRMMTTTSEKAREGLVRRR